MEVSLTLLNEFRQLFSGNINAYGVHQYSYTENGKKEGGKNFTKVEPLLEEHYKKHLEGKIGLGVIPIQPGNICNFCVLDVDEYTKDFKYFLGIIFNNNIPILPFRSKSGGLHLYTFFKEALNVKKAKGYMNRIKTLLGLSNKTEVFPKQDSLVPGQVGNWINLPYFNYIHTKQYLISPNFEPCSFPEALMKIKASLQSEESLLQFLEDLPLNDAPPCLQSIYMSKHTDFRNEYLFSLAGYYKSKYGDEFEHKLAEANSELRKPLSIEELNKSVISSHKKKDYTYKCNNSPLIDFCDKLICKNREHGIGGEEINQLSYEDFIQYSTDPPYYEWIVNGKSLKFYNELDIIQQHKFRMLCFRLLHILPNRLKEVKWTRIINNALKNVIIKEVTSEEDISPGALFKEYLTEFLERRALAINKAHILIDRVFKDDKLQSYVFKSRNLINFLTSQKHFYFYSPTEIQDKLISLGGSPKRYYIDSNHGATRTWILPYKAIEKFVDQVPKKEEIELNFEGEEENEPF